MPRRVVAHVACPAVRRTDQKHVGSVCWRGPEGPSSPAMVTFDANHVVSKDLGQMITCFNSSWHPSR